MICIRLYAAHIKMIMINVVSFIIIAALNYDVHEKNVKFKKKVNKKKITEITVR